MSNIFAPIIAQNGVLALNIGTGAPVNPTQCQGLLLDSAGAVYATNTGPATVYAAGMPFDSAGRLYVEAAPVAGYSQGIPFTSSGALAVSSDTNPTQYSQGLPISADGGISATGVTSPAFTGKLLFITRAGNGIEAWDLTALPPTLETGVFAVAYPETLALGIDHHLASGKLAIAGAQTLYIYNTLVFPFELDRTIALPAPAGWSYTTVKWSGNAAMIAVGGSSASAPFCLIDTSDWTFTTVETVNTDHAAFNSTSTRLAFNSLNGNPAGGVRTYDVTNPKVPVNFFVGTGADGTSAYEGVAIHPVHNMLHSNFVNLNDTYEWNINAQTFTRTFDPNVIMRRMIFNLDGSLYARLSSTNILVYNASNADSTTWTTRSFAVGSTIPATTATTAQRNGLAISPNNEFMTLWQSYDPANESRWLWDLTVEPIQRITWVAGFTLPFSRTAFVYPT